MGFCACGVSSMVSSLSMVSRDGLASGSPSSLSRSLAIPALPPDDDTTAMPPTLRRPG